MAAFKRARSQVALSPFLAVGRDEVGAAMQRRLTLDADHWTALLDRLEAARDEAQATLNSPNSSTALCEADKVSALRHYHGIYELATRLLPLPATRWVRWRDGLRSFFANEVGSSKINEESDEQLRKCRAELLETQRGAQEVAFWGSAAGLAAGLSRLAQRTALDTTGSQEHEKESVAEDEGMPAVGERADELTHFVRRHFRTLHDFNQLCHFAQHLYGEYASIGTLQRSWLSEMLLGETMVAAVEHVMRQTFRRDFSVPSCELRDTLRREYDEFEVDEGKRAAMEALAAATLQSPWCIAAEALYRYEATSLQPSHVAPNQATVGDGAGVDEGGGVVSGGCVTWDDKATALADALARAMSSSAGGSGGGDLSVLGLCMQRVLEKEPAPAVVNAARLDYALVVLQRWLVYYLTHSAHRWSSETIFCARDDADLWLFVLQRHTVLLRWALRQTSTHDVHAGRWQGAVQALRAVAFGVMHCAHTYVAAVAQSTAKAPRRAARVQTAWSATASWVQNELIELFAAAVRADMTADNAVPTVVLRHAVQSELQLLLSQVLALCVDQHGTLTRARHEARQSLRALVQAGVDLVGDAQICATDTVTVTQTLLRLLEQLLQECAADATLVTTMLDSYVVLMRRVATVLVGHGDAAAQLIARLGDGWVRCLAVQSASTPCAVAYLLPHSQRRGHLLVDVSCERRKAVKRVRGLTASQGDKQADDQA